MTKNIQKRNWKKASKMVHCQKKSNKHENSAIQETENKNYKMYRKQIKNGRSPSLSVTTLNVNELNTD